MGNGGAVRQNTYKRRSSSPARHWEPPQHALSERWASPARRRRSELAERLSAARRAVLAALEKEVAACGSAWDTVEEELQVCLAQAPAAGSAAQARGMVRAAVMVRDSTQFGLAIQRANSIGLRLNSPALRIALEAMLAREESEGLCRCLASALADDDRIALALWLEEGASKSLNVPSEVREYWQFVTQPEIESRIRVAPSFDSFDRQEIFDVRVAEAHAMARLRDLRNLVAEADRCGLDSDLARAALIALEEEAELGMSARGTLGDVRNSAPKPSPSTKYSGPFVADSELASLKAWSAKALKAELTQLGADFKGICEKEELMQLVCEFRAHSAAGGGSTRATRRPSGSARDAGQSPHPSAGSRSASRKVHESSSQSEQRSHSKREGCGPDAHGAEARGGEGAAGSSSKGAVASGPRPGKGSAGSEARKPQPSVPREEAPPKQPEPPSRKGGLTREEALRYLEIAGEDPTASELSKAYKQAALKWHPDRPHNHERQEEATKRFQQARAAFELLRACPRKE